eukprot:GHVU01147922.1.p1 GENE.GHVU01147922.1~~GHVU01147922.1.p1  ORF type:complete len:114 (-),score=5.46 GHVU01147922.1:149-490(-)
MQNPANDGKQYLLLNWQARAGARSQYYQQPNGKQAAWRGRQATDSRLKNPGCFSADSPPLVPAILHSLPIPKTRKEIHSVTRYTPQLSFTNPRRLAQRITVTTHETSQTPVDR